MAKSNKKTVEHTPGPWKVSTTKGMWSQCVYDSGGRLIAKAWNSKDEIQSI